MALCHPALFIQNAAVQTSRRITVLQEREENGETGMV